MKRTHPKLRRMAIAAAAALACAGGCRSGPSTGLTNPFLAPDRVPPPGTRALAPGAARPYYPGDPLPAMQSSTGGGTMPDAAPPDGASARLAVADEPETSAKVAFSNERSVAIPGDNDALRFPMPEPPAPAPAAPLAAATTPQAVQPATLSAAPQRVSPSSESKVVPAAYEQNPAPATPTPANTGMWRSPRIASAPTDPWRGTPLSIQPAPSPVSLPPPPITAASTFVNAPQDSMGVTLRAVPSPPPEPVESAPPRIRLPGYESPHATLASPYPVQQAAYFAGQPAVSGSYRDGFRPRSTMR